MSDWTDGYVADIAYTHGYYAELNPLRSRFALLKAGYAFPASDAACELGFGQGISINAHASATTVEWHGTDFNPTQAGYAQGLGAATGARVHLHDEAFAEFCSRSDLPQFDFIGLHGIWSWISDANRHVIVDFLRRKLKVGGVLYISYNTQPGWAAMVPVRDLMAQYADLMGMPGAGIVSRIDGAIGFAQKVIGSGARFGQANPQIAQRLAALKTQDRNYIAHEYFNSDWLPMSFAKMHGWLDDAKLGYACSAHLVDHVDAVNLSAAQQEIIHAIPDRMFKESVRDFMVNSQFRRDYWVKGLRPLPALQRMELLRQQCFVLAMDRSKITLTVTGALGEGNMAPHLYLPVIELLADGQVHSLREMERALEGTGGSFDTLLEVVAILIAKGSIHPAQDAAAIAAAAPSTRAFNRKLCEQARDSSAVSVLASPVTGGGISVPRLEQLMLLARADGADNPEDWARSVFQIMSMQGQRVHKAGKPLETPEQELATLVEVAIELRDTRLFMLDALQVKC